ncbi:MAG: MBL fold metallo-hydrolase [Anaerolineales bacterium]|jgi:ribonuclease Z
MAKVIILGSSNSISSDLHDNTHMIIVGQERTVLVDCVSSPVQRLERVGVDPKELTDLVTTHFHPDHVSGVPLLLLDMWLMGRKKPLDIYGLHHTLDRLESMMGFYGWNEWPGFFPVAFHRLPAEEMMPVVECSEFRLLSSPVHHFIPTIGLRLEVSASRKSMAYSCDTEPCAEVLRLAAGVDVLIHEASGEGPGHSSARQAGEAARHAEAAKLLLIHYPTGKYQPSDLVEEARSQFAGEIALAEDFMTIDLG